MTQSALLESDFAFPIPLPVSDQSVQAAVAGLDAAFAGARMVTVPADGRFVFFSDLHRGDGAYLDRFLPNKPTFLAALDHYSAQEFSYVEVGDGDELWHHDRFAVILEAHRDLFDRLHALDRAGRLHLLVGNHDLGRDRAAASVKDGLPVRTALRLRCPDDVEIFVTHGHQADLRMGRLQRLLVRHVCRPFEARAHSLAPRDDRLDRLIRAVTLKVEDWLARDVHHVELRIRAWLAGRSQAMICGHTHRPRFAAPTQLPYFNTGSCIEVAGITGIELVDGALHFVTWRADGRGRFVRTVEASRALATLRPA